MDKSIRWVMMQKFGAFLDLPYTHVCCGNSSNSFLSKLQSMHIWNM